VTLREAWAKLRFPSAVVVAAAALALAACAPQKSAQRPDEKPAVPVAKPPERVDMPETVITVSKDELPLVGMDEAQLFDCGTRAFSASDHPKAARCFDRLVGLFPQSPNWASSLYNAALAHERMAAWPAAVERWERYLARFPPAPAPANSDEIDATFHAAYCEHETGQLAKAAARLHGLSLREGLQQSRRGEAMVQEAVCRIEDSGLARAASSQDQARLSGRSEGERTLRAALAIYDKAGDGEVDPGLLAQAEFWVGEIYRSYFEEVVLDPKAMAEKGLADALETKAQFLLSAQGHYLRAIRRGDGEWATASGFRIGELYEALHQQMVAAPMPADLTEEQVRVYREELKKKVRVLLDKAMKIYEQTFATAQRVNAKSPYVDKTSEALARMRTLLLEEKRK
jgi:tetratricopeptide (TPR) repeat protein